MFEVFFIRSALVHSSKVLEEYISVEPFTLEFTNYLVTFSFQFFPKR